MKPKFDFKPVPAEGMPLLQEYKKAMDALNDDIERIQKEAQRAAEVRHAAGLEELKLLWYKLAPLAGLDAEKTWDDGEWGVDTRYLDAGFGALTHIERPRHPLEAMMGSIPQAGPDEGEGPPPGASIN